MGNQPPNSPYSSHRHGFHYFFFSFLGRPSGNLAWIWRQMAQGPTSTASTPSPRKPHDESGACRAAVSQSRVDIGTRYDLDLLRHLATLENVERDHIVGVGCGRTHSEQPCAKKSPRLHTADLLSAFGGDVLHGSGVAVEGLRRGRALGLRADERGRSERQRTRGTLSTIEWVTLAARRLSAQRETDTDNSHRRAQWTSTRR